MLMELYICKWFISHSNLDVFDIDSTIMCHLVMDNNRLRELLFVRHLNLIDNPAREYDDVKLNKLSVWNRSYLTSIAFNVKILIHRNNTDCFRRALWQTLSTIDFEHMFIYYLRLPDILDTYILHIAGHRYYNVNRLNVLIIIKIISYLW